MVTTLGHDLRFEIIEQLKNGSMTISQLSNSIHVSRTSIMRNIATLIEENVIELTMIKGTEKYYELCPKYFEIAKTSVNQYIDFIIPHFKD